MKFSTMLRAGVAAIVFPIGVLPIGAVAYGQTSPSDFTQGMRYDPLGRPTGTIFPDPDGGGGLHYAATRLSYDPAGRLIKVEVGELAFWQSEAIAPANWSGFTIFRTTETEYANGKKGKEKVSSNGIVYQVTQFSYDALGRLQCTAVRMNPAVFGSLPSSACTLGTAGSDGPDRITRNSYDSESRLIRVEKAVGTIIQIDYARFEYTLNGKRKAVIDANGNRAELAYDGHDRQVRWTFPSKTIVGSVNAADYEEYGYDANGNRTSLRKRDGRTIAYAHDALSRVTSKTYPNGGARPVYYSYDLRGLQTAARFDSTTGADAVTTGWDGFGRQASSTTAMSGTSRTLTYLHDANGARTRITHPDGTFFNYYRDGLDRLYYADLNGTTPLFYPPYDSAGRVGVLYRLNQAASNWTFGTTYGYDGISRLSAYQHAFTGSAANVQTSFGYNPASQVTSRTRDNDDYRFTSYINSDLSYARNGLNQYSAVGANSYSYDANGNLTSDGVKTYSYDIENRLTGSSAGVTLTYDPLSRLWQTYSPSTSTTQFLYDGDALVTEFDGSGNMLKRYVHGTAKDEDNPLVEYVGSAISSPRYLFADHQGSIIAAADANGYRTSVSSYDEYGVPASGNTGRFQYTGQAWLPEIGMYHYKSRIYSPMLGRFLQTDPIGYDDQINLYAYVANDPVNKRDSTGKRIVVTIHEVGAGNYHAKIIIVPDDQARFRDDPRFQSSEKGTRFMTIGGGPDSIWNVFGPLVGNNNRPNDVSKMLSGESLEIARIVPGKGDTENNLINRMIAVAGSYKDDKDYSWFPSKKGDDYNSNSFAYGVLGAVGAANAPIPYGISLPGADKPLPLNSFCETDMNGCKK